MRKTRTESQPNPSFNLPPAAQLLDSDFRPLFPCRWPAAGFLCLLFIPHSFVLIAPLANPMAARVPWCSSLCPPHSHWSHNDGIKENEELISYKDVSENNNLTTECFTETKCLCFHRNPRPLCCYLMFTIIYLFKIIIITLFFSFILCFYILKLYSGPGENCFSKPHVLWFNLI